MRRRASFALVIGLCTVALSGCGTKPAPAPPRAVKRPPVVIRGIPVPPSTYVSMASSIDLFEIKSSQLAQTRAQNAGLRDFARMMVSAHQGLGSQLSFAGRRLNLLPSAELLPEHQRMLDTLTSTSDFDATYRRQQIQVHEAALKLHGDFAATGQSPTLRPVAKSAVPIIRAHLQRLRGL